MTVKTPPLTKKALLKYFEDYRQAFPDWTVKHKVMLVRSEGVIEQQIAFEALRAGSYRPSSSIKVAGPDRGFLLLSQFLDIKHEQIWPREHERKFPLVLQAMEEQFRPSIRRPLDPSVVLRLAEEEVADGRAGNINYCCGLAVLSAAIGKNERGLFWCNQVEEKLQSLGREPAEWELLFAQFARDLRMAIEEGRASDFLNNIVGDSA
ncbi:MAG TPA: hypothetical protein VJR02_21060 [Pyrinomonadaceae bacterium]|nr:hypothetical protein [Pyrinomonadaceae bacterium]